MHEDEHEAGRDLTEEMDSEDTPHDAVLLDEFSIVVELE